MKKLIVAICVLFCLCPVFSKSLTFSGTGATKEAAQQAVLEKLSSAVSSSINYSSGYTVTDDGITANQNIITNLTSKVMRSNSFFDFWGASLEETDAGYTATVVFPNEDESKIKEICSKLIFIIDSSERETVEDYVDIFEAYNAYEIFSYLASELSISISAPVSDKALLKVAFSTLLKEEESSLKTELKNLKTSEERRKEINERLLTLDKISQLYDLNTVFYDKMPELEILIAVIEEQKEAIGELFNKRESQIEYYISQAKTEIDEIEKEISNRAWTNFDYDKSGKVSENSKNKREAERKDRVNEVIDNLSEEVKNVEDLYSTQIEALLEALTKNNLALQRAPEQRTSTSSEKVSLTIGQYDPEKEYWPFTLTLQFSFGEVPISGTISLSAAEKILEEPVAEDYESTIKAINHINATLKTLDDIAVKVSYTITPEASASNYCIKANLTFLHVDTTFFCHEEEKTFELEKPLSLVWRTYGFASDADQAATNATEEMAKLAGNEEYAKFAGKISTEERGSLFIARMDINSDSVSQLINKIDENNQKVSGLSLEEENISEINNLLMASENIVSFLNGLGFFFNHKVPYNTSYITALYASYCYKNDLSGSLVSEYKKGLSFLELKKAVELIKEKKYTPQESGDISAYISSTFINGIETLKKQIATKKAEISVELNKIKAEIESKITEKTAEFTKRYSYSSDSAQRKINEMKPYYEGLLPSALYAKETELLASYDYESKLAEITAAIERIKKGQLSINSMSSSLLHLSWGKTDLATGQKYFVLRFQYDNYEYSFSDKVKTSSLFEDSALDPSEMGVELYSAYTEYMKTLDYASFSNFFVAEITCSFDYTDVNENNCVYDLLLSSLTIKRRDTGEVVYEKNFTAKKILSIPVESVDYSAPTPTIERPEDYDESFSYSQALEYFENGSYGYWTPFGVSFIEDKFTIGMEGGALFFKNRFGFMTGLTFKIIAKETKEADGVLFGANANLLYRITNKIAVGLGVEGHIGSTSSIYGVFNYIKYPFHINAKIGITLNSPAFFASVGFGPSPFDLTYIFSTSN